MKINKSFTIEYDLADLLARESNASGLVEHLLREYYNEKLENLPQIITDLKQKAKEIRQKMHKIKQKQRENDQKQRGLLLEERKRQLAVWESRGLSNAEIEKLKKHHWWHYNGSIEDGLD